MGLKTQDDRIEESPDEEEGMLQKQMEEEVMKYLDLSREVSEEEIYEQIDRAFAVVASEISGLATQTKDATVNISELIGNVSGQLCGMVERIENMLSNAKKQNEAAQSTANSFEEISGKAEIVYHEAEKLDSLVAGLTHANEQIMQGIETISSVTEEVTAHSNETLQISERNSSITMEVGEIVQTISNLAEQLKSEEA